MNTDILDITFVFTRDSCTKRLKLTIDTSIGATKAINVLTTKLRRLGCPVKTLVLYPLMAEFDPSKENDEPRG
ncbi:hypothetical protein IWW57_005106, partial [Coemansia sp. S610]